MSSEENSSELMEGEVLRVVGKKRCSSSRCLVAVGCRAVSLDQSKSSFN